jgi:hypothetical protein
MSFKTNMNMKKSTKYTTMDDYNLINPKDKEINLLDRVISEN